MTAKLATLPAQTGITSAIAILIAASASLAEVAIQSHTGGTPTGQACPSSDTIGWKFTVGSNDLSVTALGSNDLAMDGLAGDVQVGIWDSSGTLLGMIVVPGGTTGTLIDDFRYAPLGAPITLSSGQQYTIGGKCTGVGNAESISPSTHTFATDLAAAGGRYRSGDMMFSEPTNDLGGDILLGPNFEFEVVMTGTPSATATATATDTASSTATATETASSTATATDTPTATETATPTATATDTATATATATATDAPTPQPIGAPCSDDAQCASTFCVDGLCCDTACTLNGTACNIPPEPGICTEVQYGVPATSKTGLLIAGIVLILLAAVATRRSRGNRPV